MSSLAGVKAFPKSARKSMLVNKRTTAGDMSPDMVKQFRALQKENARLRKVVADQALDNAILKEAAWGNL